MTKLQKYWTINQAAAEIGCPAKRLYARIASGDLVTHRLGCGRHTVTLTDARRAEAMQPKKRGQRAKFSRATILDMLASGKSVSEVAAAVGCTIGRVYQIRRGAAI